jgi:hypothetical protein
MKKIFIIIGFIFSGVIVFAQEDATNLTPPENVVSKDLTYDATTGANQTTILNPDYAHRTTPEEIMDETNLDTDSAYAAVYMDTYNHASIQYSLSGGVTLTVYGANDESASDTDETSGWVDLGSTLLGAASVTDTDGFIFIDTDFIIHKFLVKVETSDATNAANLFLKKGY